MEKYNIIVVFNQTMDQVLFCIKAKEPYKGFYNFVGGKVEENKTNKNIFRKLIKTKRLVIFAK